MTDHADAPDPHASDLEWAEFLLGTGESDDEGAEPQPGDDNYVCPCTDLEPESQGLLRCQECGERYGDEDDVPFETTARSRTRARNHDREN